MHHNLPPYLGCQNVDRDSIFRLAAQICKGMGEASCSRGTRGAAASPHDSHREVICSHQAHPPVSALTHLQHTSMMVAPRCWCHVPSQVSKSLGLALAKLTPEQSWSSSFIAGENVERKPPLMIITGASSAASRAFRLKFHAIPQSSMCSKHEAAP